ncbi:MAG: methylglyoxal synthase [Candidatus Zixiibacteriota bacterium]|nr:MAG: methylglyoxal synthase [candidate division Zixibacteria bacterium]
MLPPKEDGGVIILASLITQRKLSIVWPFFHPHTAHLLYPDNLALLRLADQWRVKKLLNTGSVNEWLKCEAKRDEKFNLQKPEFKIDFPSGTEMHVSVGTSSDDCLQAYPVPGALHELECDVPLLKDSQLERATIALISHDEMKQRMLDFVIDYEHELAKFRAILTTGTTGKLIREASPRLRNKVKPYHSGPKGGDIEIATEVLLGGCNVVIFFVDPLHPHPHIEDIRVVFSSCMIKDEVPVLSNEVQARAWMDRRTRGI